VIECSRLQACQFAGHILSMDPPESVDDDVRDVLGELANMIGGNLKSNFSSQVRLSMPSVMDGSDYDLRICGSEVRERSALNAPTASSGSPSSSPRTRPSQGTRMIRIGSCLGAICGVGFGVHRATKPLHRI